MTAPKSREEAAQAIAREVNGDVAMALMRAAFVMRHSMERTFATQEPRLTPAELAILHMLSIADGQRVGDLADASIRDRTTLTRIADRMVKKDLIERRPDPDDRRAVQLWITATGRKVHRRLLPLRHELVERVTGHLDNAEREIVIRALVSIREHLLTDLAACQDSPPEPVNVATTSALRSRDPAQARRPPHLPGSMLLRQGLHLPSTTDDAPGRTRSSTDYPDRLLGED